MVGRSKDRWKEQKLYDPYFKQVVTVVDEDYWDEPSYIKGRALLVRYSDGTEMWVHESAFIQKEEL